METYVDAAYAVHDDMRSHTGGVIGFGGKGILMAKTTKQKLNTESSTEAEVVGASDFLPWTIWIKRFLEHQGYETTSNVFHQDNMSAMKLERNGIMSCGQKSRHINIRYFFIKDVVQRENIKIEYCPTEIMIADYFTKALQGNLFRAMRDTIMGLASFDSLKERVGKREKSEKKISERSNETKMTETNDPQKKSNKEENRCSEQQKSYADALRQGLVTSKKG